MWFDQRVLRARICCSFEDSSRSISEYRAICLLSCLFRDRFLLLDQVTHHGRQNSNSYTHNCSKRYRGEDCVHCQGWVQTEKRFDWHYKWQKNRLEPQRIKRRLEGLIEPTIRMVFASKHSNCHEHYRRRQSPDRSYDQSDFQMPCFQKTRKSYALQAFYYLNRFFTSLKIIPWLCLVCLLD